MLLEDRFPPSVETSSSLQIDKQKLSSRFMVTTTGPPPSTRARHATAPSRSVPDAPRGRSASGPTAGLVLGPHGAPDILHSPQSFHGESQQEEVKATAQYFELNHKNAKGRARWGLCTGTEPVSQGSLKSAPSAAQRSPDDGPTASAAGNDSETQASSPERPSERSRKPRRV